MKKADIGIIGLAVMGENLALNFESKGYTVAIYNKKDHPEDDVVGVFRKGRGKNKNFIGAETLKEFVDSLNHPRKIMMMIRAGEPVDEVKNQLISLLSPGDIIIDGGNSDFHDTERRVKECEEHKILFVGAGVSGGEEGALNGPSIMPGGSIDAWPHIKEPLQNVAAKLDDGTPCCQWIGPGGAGHFVKMVHNGIEYGDMQIIAEAYSLLKNCGNKSNEMISEIFNTWNRGELNSFLIEITAQIFRYKDKDGTFLIDKILDVAGQKGTGKWSVITALEENDPLTLITQAVYARILSSLSEDRNHASQIYSNFSTESQRVSNIEANAIKNALYASKIISYAQGFSLLKKASDRYQWNLDLGSIAMIWRKGCIIRSAFLNRITQAYTENPYLENLLFDEYFINTINGLLVNWRQVISEGVLQGIPLPCMSAALSYFDGLRTRHSTANLIQAQRDYFGAHTYERTDAERGKFFHTNWTGKGSNTTSGSYQL